jgi:hypothetical protein
MSKRVEYEIPGGLKAAQQQFEQWRSSHTGRRPIPEPLWSLAATLAKEHGVSGLYIISKSSGIKGGRFSPGPITGSNTSRAGMSERKTPLGTGSQGRIRRFGIHLRRSSLWADRMKINSIIPPRSQWS